MEKKECVPTPPPHTLTHTTTWSFNKPNNSCSHNTNICHPTICQLVVLRGARNGMRPLRHCHHHRHLPISVCVCVSECQRKREDASWVDQYPWLRDHSDAYRPSMTCACVLCVCVSMSDSIQWQSGEWVEDWWFNERRKQMSWWILFSAPLCPHLFLSLRLSWCLSISSRISFLLSLFLLSVSS